MFIVIFLGEPRSTSHLISLTPASGYFGVANPGPRPSLLRHAIRVRGESLSQYLDRHIPGAKLGCDAVRSERLADHLRRRSAEPLFVIVKRILMSFGDDGEPHHGVAEFAPVLELLVAHPDLVVAHRRQHLGQLPIGFRDRFDSASDKTLVLGEVFALFGELFPLFGELLPVFLKLTLVLIVHGLGGSSTKKYVKGMANMLNQSGLDVVAINLRSCSGEPNLLPRFYHGADIKDIETVITHARTKMGYEKISLIGFSMGGGIVLNYLGRLGADIPKYIHRAVAFSVPVDLSASADHMEKGYCKMYMKYFLYEFRIKMREKERLRPGSNDLSQLDNIKTFREFDEHYNSKWYGYSSADEFYFNTSSIDWLENIQVPSLIISAKNDPFLPPDCYTFKASVKNSNLFLELPDLGGHLGFFTLKRGGYFWSEKRAVEWLSI